jgi:outer membrane murein-binding lipoprotein Lpp
MKNLLFLAPVIILSAFLIGCDNDTENQTNKNPAEPDIVIEGLHLGVVGFNDTVAINPISNNVTRINAFIDNLSNNTDATAMCYGLSEGIDLLEELDAENEIDETFIVLFTDGYDNYSATYFNNVFQPDVVDHTRSILENTTINNNPVKCYTIGLEGKGTLNDTELEKLAVNGEYKKADSYTLSTTFTEIANSMIANSTYFQRSTQIGSN